MAKDTHVRPPKAFGTRYVDPMIVLTMLENLPGQTSPVLMTYFGISYNTYRKIRAGEPIRSSVADRLERKVAERRKAFLLCEQDRR